MGALKITYRFIFPDGRAKSYDVELSAETGHLTKAPEGKIDDEWTALEHKKCVHCPLNAAESPKCPVAANLSAVSNDFKNERSFDKVTVEVDTLERSYRKEKSLQDGLFALFGLIMATSACPHLDFLRPMARFHLPFSSHRETTVRSVSFYLLRQYFVAKSGATPDFELKNLAALYKEIEEVNLGIVRRIRSVAKADAETNSIVILDGYAKLLSSSLSNGLQDLEKMFSA